jgi:hypothetical protein
MNRYIFRKIKEIVGVGLNKWRDFIRENPLLFPTVFINWSANHKDLIHDAYKNAPNSNKSLLGSNPNDHTPSQEVCKNFLELFEKELFTDVIFKIGKKELERTQKYLGM